MEPYCRHGTPGLAALHPRGRFRPMRTRRRTRLRTIGVAAALATVALAAAGPFAQAQGSSATAEPVVLRVGTTIDLITDNPFAVSAGSDWSVVTAQYDMLLKFDDATLSPAPSLAEGCEPNSDSTVWTCTLRKGLKWSDGSAAHVERRGVLLSVHHRQQGAAVPRVLPVHPHVLHPRRPDPDLDLRAADVRTRHAAVGLHRAAEGVAGRRRQGHGRDQGAAEHAVDRERAVHPYLVEPGPGLDDGQEPQLLGSATQRRPASSSACTRTRRP